MRVRCVSIICMIHDVSQILCVWAREGETNSKCRTEEHELGGCKTEGWVCERELEEQCFFGFLSVVEQSGWGQRKGGRPRKWSRTLEGFRKCSGISGAGGEWWHERRTWQMQPTGTWKKGPKLNGGIVSPFFALVPHTPHSFPHTHTHTQAPISALSCSLPRMVHDVDDKCAIPIHITDKKGSATSLRWRGGGAACGQEGGWLSFGYWSYTVYANITFQFWCNDLTEHWRHETLSSFNTDRSRCRPEYDRLCLKSELRLENESFLKISLTQMWIKWEISNFFGKSSRNSLYLSVLHGNIYH